MQIVAGYEKTLIERIEMQKPRHNQIFCYYSTERLKVYEQFRHMFVGELLREEVLRGWRKAGYFIVSQTGTGKSTLIVEEVANIAMKRGKRVLLVVPRTALSMQYKREFGERYCPNRLEELTNMGLQKESHWGPADIYLMQNFMNVGLRERLIRNRANYDFLVIDEAHAFVGDAGFNPYTEDILRFLIQKIGRDLKRIYLTATPEIILREVVELEAGVENREMPGFTRIGFPKEDVWMTMFRFKVDYRYVQPFFFEKENELKILLQDLPDSEKAVVFVRSKAQGIRLRDVLGREDAVYIDAENKMDEEVVTFSEILSKNMFQQKFLIVTKFLDVGVNLKDFMIKHFVIFSYYKEDIIQMMGRKRIEQSEILRLYIRVPTAQEIMRDMEQLEKERAEIEQAERIYKKNYTGFYCDLPHPVYVESEQGMMQFRSNRFTYALNYYHIQALKEYMAGGSDRNFYDNFVNIILSWIPGHQEARRCAAMNDVIRPVREEICKILEPLVETELVREEMLPLCNQLLDALRIPRRADQKDSVPVSILKKKFLEFKIPFWFKNMSKLGKKGIWTIKRGDWE